MPETLTSMANRMKQEVDRLTLWEKRLTAVCNSNQEEGARLNHGWKTLKAAREDFRKEQDRKEGSLNRQRMDITKREKFARAAERASYAAMEKAKKDVPEPGWKPTADRAKSQRERFTKASEDQALTLNKILLTLATGLKLTPQQGFSINNAIDDTYRGGQRR